jgi:5-methylcytosine-specific restriction endonuclease McrA
VEHATIDLQLRGDPGVARLPCGARPRRRAFRGRPPDTNRAGWRCQACGRRSRLDVHHVVKRSRGSSDFDLDRLVALCRSCHDQTDAPLAAGRLIVTPLGNGQFRFDVVRGPAKYR